MGRRNVSRIAKLFFMISLVVYYVRKNNWANEVLYKMFHSLRNVSKKTLLRKLKCAGILYVELESKLNTNYDRRYKSERRKCLVLVERFVRNNPNVIIFVKLTFVFGSCDSFDYSRRCEWRSKCFTNESVCVARSSICHACICKTNVIDDVN